LPLSNIFYQLSLYSKQWQQMVKPLAMIVFVSVFQFLAWVASQRQFYINNTVALLKNAMTVCAPIVHLSLYSLFYFYFPFSQINKFIQALITLRLIFRIQCPKIMYSKVSIPIIFFFFTILKFMLWKTSWKS
jgi:hypothetical protein